MQLRFVIAMTVLASVAPVFVSATAASKLVKIEVPDCNSQLMATGRSPLTVTYPNAHMIEVISFDSFNLATLLAGQNPDLLMIGDNHSRPEQRLPLASLAQYLKQRGYTHYVIEASATPEMQTFLDLYNQNSIRDLNAAPENLGPGERSSFNEIVASMHAAGLIIVAGDHPDNMSRQNQHAQVDAQTRERFIVRTIKDLITAGGKPVALFGSFHTSAMPGYAAAELSKLGIAVFSYRLHIPTAHPTSSMYSPASFYSLGSLLSPFSAIPTIQLDLPGHSRVKNSDNEN